jgi:hypothetical protein
MIHIDKKISEKIDAANKGNRVRLYSENSYTEFAACVEKLKELFPDKEFHLIDFTHHEKLPNSYKGAAFATTGIFRQGEYFFTRAKNNPTCFCFEISFAGEDPGIKRKIGKATKLSSGCYRFTDPWDLVN